MTLTITDPNYRSRVLAVHTGLSRAEARELTRVYRRLGYPPRCIATTLAGERERAA